MTHTECYMTKLAKTDPSKYEDVSKAMKSKDEKTLEAMGTPSGQEVFWNIAGAGAGGLGAYLLSRRFRRDASKRQRALDVAIGALLGLGGTQVVLNTAGDEKSGLSLKQMMRADKIIGDAANDNSQGENNPYWLSPNKWNVGAAALTGSIYPAYRALGGETAKYQAIRKAVADANKALPEKQLNKAVNRALRKQTGKELATWSLIPAAANYAGASVIKGFADKASGSSEGR